MQLEATAAEIINTTEAARITGRSVDAVRSAIREGSISAVGRTVTGRPLIRRADVLAWNERARRGSGHPTKPWERAIEALELLGPATTSEVGAFLGIHPGNARKHLAILAQQGRVRRGEDGQWVTIERSRLTTT